MAQKKKGKKITINEKDLMFGFTQKEAKNGRKRTAKKKK